MEPEVRHRVAWLVLAVAGFAAAILVRLYGLQVERGAELRAQARRQQQQQVHVRGHRGAILDRHGRELAVSLETFSLFAHPPRVSESHNAARLLAPLLQVPERKLLEKLRSKAPFVWLKRRLDPDTAEAVRRLRLPVGRGEAFGFEREGKRLYPRGSLGVHVVGFADIDQKGIEGIERVYDARLQPGKTSYLALRDGRGGTVLQRISQPERPPEDVVLTLDLFLQHVVERELDRAVRETGAKAASAILLDPATGQVLALANRPTVDPARYGEAAPGARRNRAVTDLYEPGSTFKVVTAASALDQGTVTPDRLFDCQNGVIVVAGHAIRDVHPHGLLTLREVLEESSNVGIIKVGRTLTHDVFRRYVVDFGFGRRTGIELPWEPNGKLTPLRSWSALSPVSLAMGYEVGVTALQMASAMAAIANGGVWNGPRIVLGFRDAEGSFTAASHPPSRRVVSERTAATVAALLEGVIHRGTGKQAWVAGYRMAGKTGTARKSIPGTGYSREDRIPSFIGFAPVHRPRLAGLVVLDSPSGSVYYGGQVAAPVFARIMAEALTSLRVPPDVDPLLDRPADERKALEAKKTSGLELARSVRRAPARLNPLAGETAAGEVPDVLLLSLREAVAALAQRGYRSRITGTGVVLEQSPPPATPLSAGQICSLTLGEPAPAEVGDGPVLVDAAPRGSQ